MNKLEKIFNVNGIVINPINTLSTPEEVDAEIEKLSFLFCNELSASNPMAVHDLDKKVYLLPLNYSQELINGSDISLIYSDYLYNLIDVNNSTHTDFIMYYNGVYDLEKALFLSRAGTIRITSCNVCSEYFQPDMEVPFINGLAKISGKFFNITEGWVYEFI